MIFLVEQIPQFKTPFCAERSFLQQKSHSIGVGFPYGADYGARTRHLHLGKVALYQMS